MSDKRIRDFDNVIAFAINNLTEFIIDDGETKRINFDIINNDIITLIDNKLSEYTPDYPTSTSQWLSKIESFNNMMTHKIIIEDTIIAPSVFTTPYYPSDIKFENGKNYILDMVMHIDIKGSMYKTYSWNNRIYIQADSSAHRFLSTTYNDTLTPDLSNPLYVDDDKITVNDTSPTGTDIVIPATSIVQDITQTSTYNEPSIALRIFNDGTYSNLEFMIIFIPATITHTTIDFLIKSSIKIHKI